MNRLRGDENKIKVRGKMLAVGDEKKAKKRDAGRGEPTQTKKEREPKREEIYKKKKIRSRRRRA